ncbi:MAG TPA: FecR domain-containing protein [Rhizomicrobium sp.]|nr:FecR domain-containing protein [Rhizomicrobium sp.]
MSERENTEMDAAHWVAREDRGLASGEREELSSWLENTSNRVAYLRLKNAWEKSTALAALGSSPKHRNRWTLSWPYKWHVFAIAAGLLVLAVTTVAMMHFRRPTQEIFYATQAGERPTIHLVDGTQIQIDANSRLRATISDGNRVVTLEKGEAYFEVVHDAGRPFVVLAGKHRISDLGTKFSVERDGDDIRVVVTEGRVRVDGVNTLSPTTPIFADGGNLVVAKANETLLTTLNPQDLSDDLGWRDGRLIFNQVTLAEAAKEFNRYNSRQLAVTGAARDIRIGGSFRADNMDVFVALIRNSLGLTAEDQGDTIILSKK